MKAKIEKSLGYQEAMQELETIAQRLENEEVSMDELAPTVERAGALLAICDSILRDTDERIRKTFEMLDQ
jgi:exodeoxyribonuclease VII small subunit